MERYSAAEGDRVRIRWDGGECVDDDFALTVCRESDASTVDGVLTTAAHADTLHRLFRDGTTFTIVLESASGERTRFERCTLLSSSGKWVAPG
ncbi:hypothetical protein ACFO0N_07190 [Halobium salinum]|uniref:Uncharacterized protein n=1 Tax=Halobium salinum TaxID=1364940 RepID=A0ABD5PAL6_9EURY|nr:hypothetical protein [Halobium salinum]